MFCKHKINLISHTLASSTHHCHHLPQTTISHHCWQPPKLATALSLIPSSPSLSHPLRLLFPPSSSSFIFPPFLPFPPPHVTSLRSSPLVLLPRLEIREVSSRAPVSVHTSVTRSLSLHLASLLLSSFLHHFLPSFFLHSFPRTQVSLALFLWSCHHDERSEISLVALVFGHASVTRGGGARSGGI